MKKLTRNETAQFLRDRDHYVILTHRRPDGDTLGSAAALCRLLRSIGKSAHVLHNPEAFPRLGWLVDDLSKAEPEEGDCLICVDVASDDMLPKAFKPFEDSITLRIDHHGASTSFTELELVEPGYASCAEIVFDLAVEMGVALDRCLAEAIYVGASTDTGCFRFANTTGHTLRTAAACVDAGARTYVLNQDLFETNTLARLKIQAWMIDHLKLMKEGTLALAVIPRAVELELGATEDDMDNISSIPRTVAGVKVAATLRESPEGDVKLSVRAVPGHDATKLAVRFGGGGHVGAAGAHIRMTLDKVLPLVEQALLEM